MIRISSKKQKINSLPHSGIRTGGETGAHNGEKQLLRSIKRTGRECCEACIYQAGNPKLAFSVNPPETIIWTTLPLFLAYAAHLNLSSAHGTYQYRRGIPCVRTLTKDSILFQSILYSG